MESLLIRASCQVSTFLSSIIGTLLIIMYFPSKSEVCLLGPASQSGGGWFLKGLVFEAGSRMCGNDAIRSVAATFIHCLSYSFLSCFRVRMILWVILFPFLYISSETPIRICLFGDNAVHISVSQMFQNISASKPDSDLCSRFINSAYVQVFSR